MRKPEGRHRDSNPEPSNHVSSALTTALSRHDRFGRLDSDPKYSVTFAARSVVSPTALAINSRPIWRRVLAYVFQKQWWGPPQGLERLPRAGLRQNRHTGLYGCWHMYFRNNGGGRHRV